MKRLLFIGISIFFLSGCAGVLKGPFPTIINPGFGTTFIPRNGDLILIQPTK